MNGVQLYTIALITLNFAIGFFSDVNGLRSYMLSVLLYAPIFGRVFGWW